MVREFFEGHGFHTFSPGNKVRLRSRDTDKKSTETVFPSFRLFSFLVYFKQYQAFLAVAGTAAQAKKALSVTMNLYRHRDGKIAIRTADDYRLVKGLTM